MSQSKVSINDDTGEVFVFPGPYSKRAKSSQDLSCVYEDIYEEIPPYSVDIQTGDFLNKTSKPIKKKVGKINIQEQIQSYAESVDIYRILEKVAISGDMSLLNRKVGTFGDYVNLPDNLNDFNAYVKKAFESGRNLPDELIKAALNISISNSDLEALISKHVNQAVIAATKNSNVKENNE